MAKKPPAPDDDDRLWQAVTGGVEPLKSNRKRPPAARPPATPAAKPIAKVEQTRPAPLKATAPPPRPVALPPLDKARPTGIDKRTAERLKRGKLGVEARLDLHGLTQAEAHRRLDHFLAEAYDSGVRTAIIITGKGRISQDGGILRQMVPRWLNQPPNRGRVVAISEAQPKDGGTGALYVRVKKKRIN
ncbi:MAG: Smr/MutS family protein [Alphaproteobacteria bacterium]|jgi:DNA-nicking Smr family endonuclease